VVFIQKLAGWKPVSHWPSKKESLKAEKKTIPMAIPRWNEDGILNP
jgi:hypothetical protein